MMHICISKLTIIIPPPNEVGGGYTGFTLLVQIVTCAKPLSETMLECFFFLPLGTNFSEILIEIHICSFKEMHLEMPSAKCQPFCLSLNVLSYWNAGLQLHSSGPTCVVPSPIKLICWENCYPHISTYTFLWCLPWNLNEFSNIIYLFTQALLLCNNAYIYLLLL